MGAAGAGKLGKQGAAGDGELQFLIVQYIVLPCSTKNTLTALKAFVQQWYNKRRLTNVWLTGWLCLHCWL
jgi:hypothetical protein